MSGRSRWPVRDVQPIPESSDSLILVEYADFRGRWPNLFRIAPTGAEIWASTPPGGPDAYAEIELDGDVVIARTHYGHTIRIDVTTGQIR
jgi:hypothetical protein